MYIDPVLKSENTVMHQLTSDNDTIKRSLDSLKKPDNSCDLKRTNTMLRLEISVDKINSLLALHQLCAADVRCLDNSSQQYLKDLCLRTCLSIQP